MHHVVRSAVSILISTLAFSAIACVVSTSCMPSGHHHARAFGEHESHLQSLSLATLSSTSHLAVVIFVALIVALVVTYVLRTSSVIEPLYGPPRRQKLHRILFQLRSPPCPVA